MKNPHLIDGYLCKHRNKTGVQYRIKLWKVTRDLIADARDNVGADELLFVTKQGFPLVHEGPQSKTSALSQAFERLVKEAGVEATWAQFRDTSATRIEEIAKTGEGEIDKNLVSMFLAHADGRTARFYIQADSKTLPSAKLDKALEELEKVYELEYKSAAKSHDASLIHPETAGAPVA
ncbi:MAG TPA: tyrosine-type recombinase/integrase [Phycisphaerae bacterium]|nr:tyrosine-type recombinase/integrase [Phycisphaerae bacterium]